MMTPLTAAQIARADKIIAAFEKIWPACFHVCEKRRRPLAIGTRQTLLVQLGPALKRGIINETDIRIALQRYTSAVGYLSHCAINNNPRIGLDGQVSGRPVTARDAARARVRLACELKVGTEGVGRAEVGLSATGTENCQTL